MSGQNRVSRVDNYHLIFCDSYEFSKDYINSLCSNKKSFIEFLGFAIDPEQWRDHGERMVAYARSRNENLVNAGVLTTRFLEECRRRSIGDKKERSCILIVEVADATSARDLWDKIGYNNVDRYLYEDGVMTLGFD